MCERECVCDREIKNTESAPSSAHISQKEREREGGREGEGERERDSERESERERESSKESMNSAASHCADFPNSFPKQTYTMSQFACIFGDTAESGLQALRGGRTRHWQGVSNK